MSFTNPIASHEHSLGILNLLNGYDSFLDSLGVVYDVGCGAGLDAKWWATLETREDPPEPRNYKVYAIDRTLDQIDPEVRATKGIRWIKRDFETDLMIAEKADLMWCHDAFQYSISPVTTLRNWSNYINTNGMLVMSLPQSIDYVYNRLQFTSTNYTYHNYSILNLVYMLAVNGFDCNDAYFYKNPANNWIQAAVYKSCDPMDPTTTGWFDLAKQNLLHPSIVDSLNRNGFIKQDEVVFPWLDKDFYIART